LGVQRSLLGYSYDLDVTDLNHLYDQVSADFAKLLATFATPSGGSVVGKKKAAVESSKK
jgi:hypothetical protein